MAIILLEISGFLLCCKAFYCPDRQGDAIIVDIKAILPFLILILPQYGQSGQSHALGTGPVLDLARQIAYGRGKV